MTRRLTFDTQPLAYRLELEIDPRLREMVFGDWDGRTWKELRAADGPFLEEWMKSWWHRPAPGGEGFADVARRASQWLDELLESSTGQTVVAVGHGGSIRTALCHILELPLERAFHLRLDHGRVTGLATTWRGVEVEFMNSGRFPEALADT